MDGPELRRTVRRLYGDEHGYGISVGERTRIRETGSAATFGEIMPSACIALLEYLDPKPHDVMFDLGSGVGQVILTAALGWRFGRLEGIEMARSRHRVAVAALGRARDAGLLGTESVSFSCRNFMRVSLSEATVVYTCSTAFPTVFTTRLAGRVARLRPGVRFVSTQELDLAEESKLELVDVLRLDMSWRRRSRTFVYRVRG